MIAFLLSLVACEQPAPIPGTLERTGEVLTTVNGLPITQGMVDGLLAQYPPEARDKIVAQGQTAKIKDDLVTMELIYQEALKMQIHQKPESKMALAYAERQAMARALLEQVVTDRTTDAAIKAWYDEHAVQFRKPQAKVRHILVKEEAEAQELLKQIQAGGNFAEIAAQKSMDARTAKDGGNMGWVDTKNMTKEVADAITAAAAGQVIGPIPSKGGFHLMLIEEKRDMVPLEEVKETIRTKMREDIVSSYIEELKKGAAIQAPGGAAGATVSPAPGAPAPGAPAPGAPAAPPAPKKP